MLNNDEEIAKLQVLLNNLKNKQTVDDSTPLLRRNLIELLLCLFKKFK
jgi:hypothetical protein